MKHQVPDCHLQYRTARLRSELKAKFKRVRKGKKYPWASGPKRARINAWDARLDVALAKAKKSNARRMTQRAVNRCMDKVGVMSRGVYNSKGYLKPWQKNQSKK